MSKEMKIKKIRNIIGRNLRRIRRQKRVSADVVAFAVKWNVVAVRKVELGQASLPVDKLLLMANYYGVTVDSICYGSGKFTRL